MDAIGIEILLILLLTLANGFFAAAEIGIVSAKRGRLEALAEEGSDAARTALALSDSPDRFLATVQVGITLIGTFSAAFGGARLAAELAKLLRTIPALADAADTLALLLVVLAITYLSLVLGELAPKRLALRRAEQMAVLAAPIMRRIEFIARPAIWLLTFSVANVVRLFGKDDDAANLVTTDDIVYMVREGRETGAVEHTEAEMITRIFEIADLPIRAIMTPRPDMQSIPVSASFAEAAEAIRTTGFTRLPVYEDSPENFVGVLNAKDLIAAFDAAGAFSLQKAMRPPVFVVESAPISEVLSQFRRDGTHIGLVIGEYGEVSGLVTLEDMLEELVGEIRDEHDEESEEAFVRRADGSWLISGMQPYERVVERVGLPSSDEEQPQHFVTLAGLILDRLSRIPKVGDAVIEGEFTLEVVDMDERRVDKVLITRRTPEPPEPASAPPPDDSPPRNEMS
ncbi:MAG: HlyC/CorC family transporter [Anaerolineae bacterium]|nr:HlyC/CorC family transporter [Anaerolineae bacterium]